MRSTKRFKGRHCKQMCYAGPGNGWHQRYCSEAACRKASKAASQRRWLAKPENRDHFCGSSHVERVRRWRHKHPGYLPIDKPGADLLFQVISQRYECGSIILTTNKAFKS